jgi:hypothetical protein
LLRAMARVFAREAAQRVAFDGLRWAVGAGQTDPDLAQALDLAAASRAQAGLLDDMDLVARQLAEVFRP